MERYSWTFHVFSDCIDEYTQDLMRALSLFMQYAQNTGKARLVLMVEASDNEIIYDNLLAIGDFPA